MIVNKPVCELLKLYEDISEDVIHKFTYNLAKDDDILQMFCELYPDTPQIETVDKIKRCLVGSIFCNRLTTLDIIMLTDHLCEQFPEVPETTLNQFANDILSAYCTWIDIVR